MRIYDQIWASSNDNMISTKDVFLSCLKNQSTCSATRADSLLQRTSRPSADTLICTSGPGFISNPMTFAKAEAIDILIDIKAPGQRLSKAWRPIYRSPDQAKED